VSHNSFLVKPNDRIVGVRPGISSTSPSAIHFRPRAFLRTTASPTESRHRLCGEVSALETKTLDLALQADAIDNRNCTVKEKLSYSPLGTLRPLSSLRETMPTDHSPRRNQASVSQ
jgi:hypothetical protein